MKTILIFIMSIFLINFAFGATASKDNQCKHTVTIKEVLYEGYKEIEFSVDEALDKLISKTKLKKEFFCVDVFINDKSAWEKIGLEGVKKGEETGRFILSLKKELKKDQKVKVSVKCKEICNSIEDPDQKKDCCCKGDQGDLHSEEVIVKKAIMNISQSLYEGDQAIEIYFQEGTIDQFEITVSSGENPVSGQRTVHKDIKGKGNKYVANLDKPLFAGDSVYIVGYKNAKEIICKKITVKSTIIDTGFLHSFFSIGSEFSKREEEFSKAKFFLKLEMDTHYIDVLKKGIGFVSYANITFSPLSQIEENTFDQFLDAKKWLTIQSGIYVPIKFRLRKHSGYTDVLFAGPILKFGFHTYSVNDDENNDPGNNNPNEETRRQNFPTYYSFGLRIGHFKIWAPENILPELKSHVDITVGSSDIVGVIREQGDPEYPSDRYDNVFSLFIEGRWIIPKTPFILGLEAYINLEKGKKDGVNVMVPNGTKFFIGARININSILGKLIPAKK